MALASLDVCPALLIVPPHRAGLKMVEIASAVLRERFGCDVPCIVHPDLRPDALNGEAQHITSLGEDDLALILDDVTITGKRLSRYQVHLRELGYAGRLHYLIGVARPPSEHTWEVRQNNLRLRMERPSAPHVVHAIEFAVLPDWEEHDCPWCFEQTVLKAALARTELGRRSTSQVLHCDSLPHAEGPPRRQKFPQKFAAPLPQTRSKSQIANFGS